MRTDKIRKYLIPNIPYLFIQRDKTGCKVSKGRANRLAQPDELMCKIVTRRQPVGRSQLEARPQDE